MPNELRACAACFILAAGTLHCSAGGDGSIPGDGPAGTKGTGGGSAVGMGGIGQGSGGVGGGTGAVVGSGGTAMGTGGVQSGAGGGGGFAPAGSNTAPGFVNLAPPFLAPLDAAAATPLSPPAPPGWNWFAIDGAQCRDGSPAGLFVRFTQSDRLFIYLEGGGACTNLGFCNFNPPNVNTVLSGTGETVLGSALGAVPGRQQPGVFEGGILAGIFDDANAANPFQGWNGVYIPYCTGDVYAGTKPNAMVPGVAAAQQFVGHFNMQKFIGHLVPTFKDRVSYVILTGASAGSFGAALNYSMTQDAFGEVRVDALLDSGIPFTNTYMPTCMQARWRDAWGINGMLPPDCAECFDADGGGMLKLSDFLLEKHPNGRLAAISSQHDEVIRLFFSMGLQNCANYDTADPVAITLGQIDPNVYYPAVDYAAAIDEVRSLYLPTGRLATYLIGGPNIAFHQHIWRNRFYTAAAGGVTIADFVRSFMNGAMEHIGP